MKALTVTALVALSMAASASANPSGFPDPDQCDVLPQDLMTFPRIVGIPAEEPGNSAVEIRICARNLYGLPLQNAWVEISVASQCGGFCPCPGAPLTGLTDADGMVTLNMRMGGCCNVPQAVAIVINSVPIRAYEWLVSPDFDNVAGDCAVDLADFTVFGAHFVGAAGGCGDYTGDDVCGVADFVVFGSCWRSACR